MLGRFEVQVRRAVLDRLLDQRVHVPDDRRVVARRAELGKSPRLLGLERRGDVAEVAVLALEPIDELAQLAARRDDRDDVHPGRRADVVERDDVVRGR